MTKEEIKIGRHLWEFFKGDVEKIHLWYRLKNPHLGGVKPIELIQMGRADRLLEFVEDAVESNNPEGIK